jgi:hypothetical protein
MGQGSPHTRLHTLAGDEEVLHAHDGDRGWSSMPMGRAAPSAHIAPFAPVSVGDVHALVEFHIFWTRQLRILGHSQGLDLLVVLNANLVLDRSFLLHRSHD